MNRNVVYIRVLLVVLAIVILLAFSTRSTPRHQSDAWLPSSFNPVGAGNMAFFQTLQDMNWPVERWREPFSRLSDYGTDNALIVTRSPVGWRVAFSEQEIDLLDEWVKKGNTLVLFGSLEEWDDTRALLRQIGFAVPETASSLSDLFRPIAPEGEQQIAPSPDSNLTGTLVLPRTNPLPLTYPSGTRMLWQQEGRPYVLEIPRGNGRIVCATSERLLSNAFLGRGDNLAIALQLLTPGGHVPHHLFFEESHHGFSAIYALARLLEHPGVRFAGMLTILGGLAFLVSSLVRFGPILPLQRETGRSTLEFIDSIADLYRQADLRDDMVKYLFDETHQRVLQRLNLPATASHDLIASRLQQVNPRLPKWKKLAQRLDSKDTTLVAPVDGLPPTGWLRVARELIEIKSAMA